MNDVPPAAPLLGLRSDLRAAAGSPARIFDLADRLIRGADPRLADAPKQTIAVLGDLTTDFIAHAAVFGAAQEGYAAHLYQGAFGSMVQEVVDPRSGLYAAKPDLILLCVDGRDLVTELPLGSGENDVLEAVERKVEGLVRLWDRLAEGTGGRILQHLPPPPVERLRGVADRRAPASPANQIRLANRRLMEAGRGRVCWIELDRLAEEVGARRWASPRAYYATRAPFDQKQLPDYLMAFRAAWRLACGRAKKVLALDLDNTVWGGVIGDDGLEGLTLGVGSPAGEAFVDWQDYILALKDRGVVLAAVSKNDPKIALDGFEHPASRLKPQDFSAFECAWTDKAVGLRRVAGHLNLGLDAIVFADDNPAECALVRQAAPEVEVVELGSDPSQFSGRLDAGCWFDLDSLTADDLNRGAAYQARGQALKAAEVAVDLPSFLRDLAMVGRVAEPASADWPRLAQLEQKTNQFNLTTRRYGQGELEAFGARPDALVLTLRLKDRFGDHGLVASLVAVQAGADLRIDSWLMSCRVFSRSAETFMMRALVEQSRRRGAVRILGERLPTAKNGVVADLYPRLGFAPLGPDAWSRATAAPLDDLETFIGIAADG